MNYLQSRKAAPKAKSVIAVSSPAGKATGITAGLFDQSFREYFTDFTSSVESLLGQVSGEARAERFVILDTIEVAGGMRGAGIGDSLMREFFGRAGGAPILVVADRFEAQADGFDLKLWYQSWGFRQIAELGAGPLMIAA